MSVRERERVKEQVSAKSSAENTTQPKHLPPDHWSRSGSTGHIGREEEEKAAAAATEI